MVDYEIDRLQRIDLLRIAPELRECVAYRCEVDDSGYSREVLKKNACCAERDLLFHFALHVPGSKRLDVFALDELSVLVAKKILEKNLEAEGKGCCSAAR